MWCLLLPAIAYLSAAAAFGPRQDCKLSTFGSAYVGNISHTVSGLECQRWDTNEPHNHPHDDPLRYPDDSLEDASNYCRNPDPVARTGGLWCFTTDPDVRWEYCDVPDCGDFPECKLSETGEEYLGTQDSALSGATCQPWEGGSHNFCRNPDSKPLGPWCYTDQDWEYCHVPFCKVSASCKRTSGGAEYSGTISVTGPGRPCQRWDKQFPHSHPHTDPDLFPDQDLASAENFCRNPDEKEGGLWCYTQDPDVEWQYCDIAICRDCKVTPGGAEYFGGLSETQGGETCQRWDSQSPHPHDLSDPDRYPDASLEDAANYCRNPDRKAGGPWCFTTNADTEWDYCDLPMCQGDSCDPEVPLPATVNHVLLIGIDGLHPCFVNADSSAPNIMRLADEGSYTLSGARTVLQTWSGPSWAATQCGSMVEATGVVNNLWLPGWKGHNAAITPTTGDHIPFPSVYAVLKSYDANVRTAAFYEWGWHHNMMNYGNPGSVDKDHYCHADDHGGVEVCDGYMASNASEYLQQVLFSAAKSFTFLYFDSADGAGHSHGWCSELYYETIDYVDQLVGLVLDALDDAGMSDEVLVFLSTDHGGVGTSHGGWSDDEIEIPLFVRGPGIKVNFEFTHPIKNMDIVSTAMHAMGVPASPWWDGRVLWDAFEE